jgi:hypothetical protein
MQSRIAKDENCELEWFSLGRDRKWLAGHWLTTQDQIGTNLRLHDQIAIVNNRESGIIPIASLVLLKIDFAEPRPKMTSSSHEGLTSSAEEEDQ